MNIVFFKRSRFHAIPVDHPRPASPPPPQRESEIRVGINIESDMIVLSFVDPAGYESRATLGKVQALKMASYIRVLVGEKE